MDLNKNQIIFFGTPEFAVPALEKLIQSGASLTVVTAPDKPAGRKKTLTPSPIKAIAETAHLPILTPEKIDKDFIRLIEALKPEVCIIVAYGKILPKLLLEIPKKGFINIHPSLLPQYRGPSPIQTAILKGERQTAVSIMLIDEEIDHGPILATALYDILDNAYYPEIEKELSRIGAELLAESLPQYLSGEIKPKPQDHSLATHTKKFTLEDGKIDWTRPSEIIFNQIRALNPEPGTWTTWNGKILKIQKAEPFHMNDVSPLPGTVVLNNGTVAVRTGSYYMKLLRVQIQGSRSMDIREFIAGRKELIGSRLS